MSETPNACASWGTREGCEVLAAVQFSTGAVENDRKHVELSEGDPGKIKSTGQIFQKRN